MDAIDLKRANEAAAAIAERIHFRVILWHVRLENIHSTLFSFRRLFFYTFQDRMITPL